jgi:hypothetical protein
MRRHPLRLSRHARVHAVCEYLKQYPGDHTKKCKKCPRYERHEHYGQTQRGCYATAQEVCNLAHHGNPWGWWPRIWWVQTLYQLQRKYRWIPRRKERDE